MLNEKLLRTLGLCLLLQSYIPHGYAKMESFKVDSSHTYPSFEADHMGGLSLWRGKINKTSGVVQYDETAQVGAVDILMDMDSIDFGFDDMNKHAKSDDMLDVKMHPTARYTGNLVFIDDEPREVHGELTMRGVTKPVMLEIKTFKCMFHPMKLKKVCGATASASIQRDDFGLDYAKLFGFDMTVNLQISIEALKTK